MQDPKHGETYKVNANDPSEQFQAEMLAQNAPLSVGLQYSDMFDIYALTQGDVRVLIMDVQMMRSIGKMMLEMADEWENGTHLQGEAT